MLRKSILVAFLVHVAALGGPPQTPKHVDDAHKRLRTLKPENSKYSHDKLDVKWQGETGAAASVCFADYSFF